MDERGRERNSKDESMYEFFVNFVANCIVDYAVKADPTPSDCGQFLADFWSHTTSAADATPSKTLMEYRVMLISWVQADKNVDKAAFSQTVSLENAGRVEKKLDQLESRVASSIGQSLDDYSSQLNALESKLRQYYEDFIKKSGQTSSAYLLKHFGALSDKLAQEKKQKQKSLFRWRMACLAVPACYLLLSGVMAVAIKKVDFFSSLYLGSVDILVLGIPFATMTALCVYFYRLNVIGVNVLDQMLWKVENKSAVISYYSETRLGKEDAVEMLEEEFLKFVFSPVESKEWSAPNVTDGIADIISALKKLK